MISDIKAFCKLFNESTFLPITYFDLRTEKYYSFPDKDTLQVNIQNSSPQFLNFKKNPDYFVSDSFSYYGYIENTREQYCLILGPVFSIPVSEEAIHLFMKEWAINSDSRDDVTQFLRSLPQISINQLLNTLAYLYFCINDELLSVTEHFILEDTGKKDLISSIHTEKLVESKENQRYHNTYYFEKELMQCIRNGDLLALEKMLSNNNTLTEGIVADNALRQKKNIFITLVTTATRNAILGGLGIEEAYQLSDIYIQECERSHDISFISNLSYVMLLDFTERVSRNKIPAGMSTEIFECVQFISRHTNQPIQVDDVADHIQKSRSYLTKKFKHELGFDISSFIMRCKLEEAKSLLTYTEKSLSEISSYLCFSTQAYFQNVFKKKYGLTPTQYRNKSRQIQ